MVAQKELTTAWFVYPVLPEKEELKAPFPWFGGKRKVAPEVWRRFGDVEHYVEPFAGSLAVLLGRPHPPKVETVNDLDAYVANFWRAVKYAPEEVAYYANEPVNEADLTARHIWLVNTGQERLERLFGDPEYYDAKVAGWWVWGLSAWIGSGWCSGQGPWKSVDGRLNRLDDFDKKGISRQLLHLGSSGQGVHRKRVHLANPSRGVHRKICHTGNSRGISSVADDDCNLLGVNTGLYALTDYMLCLAERLRFVRVVCGDWSRVVTPGALSHGDTVGIFLDPPYDIEMRSDVLYNTDKTGCGKISTAVRDWCIENGANPRYRIALCGYEGEHNELEKYGWDKFAWTAGRAYGRMHGETDNSKNRMLERIWFSPHCARKENHKQLELWS